MKLAIDITIPTIHPTIWTIPVLMPDNSYMIRWGVSVPGPNPNPLVTTFGSKSEAQEWIATLGS